MWKLVWLSLDWYVHRIAHKHYCLVHIVKNLNEADQKQWTEKASNESAWETATSFILSSENKPMLATDPHNPLTLHWHKHTQQFKHSRDMNTTRISLRNLS